MKEENKVYFPVESLVGLGHFNRTGALVREMIKAGLEVTVASSTFVDPKRFFGTAATRDIPPYVFLNSKNKYYRVCADGKRELVPEFNEAAYKDVRRNAHLKNIADTQPNVLVSEFWPFDRPFFDPEMKAALAAVKEQNKNALRIVSVRDVLDTRDENQMGEEDKQKKAARDAWIVETINDNFDAVLVHGDPNFIPLSETFPAAAQIKAKVIYTGYVLGDLPQRIMPDKDTGEFLVSCGSGVDGDEMMLAFVTAWQKLLDRRDEPQVAHMVNRPLHIVCGPRFAEKTYTAMTQWADATAAQYGVDIQVERYRTDYTDILAKAAFSVSLAGYNTTLETLAIGTPSLMIPKYALVEGKIRFSTEQLYRLEQLEEKGYARYAHPEDVQDANLFANIMLDEFTRQTAEAQPKAQLNFAGAKNTLAALSSLLAEKQGKVAPAPSTAPKARTAS